MKVVQPSVANRITFATFARKAGLRRHSSVTYFVPEEVEIPAKLLKGAQIDGKPYVAPEDKPKPKRTRKPKPPEPEPVDEPVEAVDDPPVPSRSYYSDPGPQTETEKE